MNGWTVADYDRQLTPRPEQSRKQVAPLLPPWMMQSQAYDALTTSASAPSVGLGTNKRKAASGSS